MDDKHIQTTNIINGQPEKSVTTGMQTVSLTSETPYAANTLHVQRLTVQQITHLDGHIKWLVLRCNYILLQTLHGKHDQQSQVHKPQSSTDSKLPHPSALPYIIKSPQPPTTWQSSTALFHFNQLPLVLQTGRQVSRQT
jgi:hypothetical protein